MPKLNRKNIIIRANNVDGIIYSCVGGVFTVKMNDGTFAECKARGVFRKKGTDVLTGDRVNVEDGMIVSVLPRKNALIRPPIANIDKLFLVVAVKDPNPNLYNIDKMLAIAVYHNIEPVILISKSDLGDDEKIYDLYRDLPYKCFMISSENPDSIEQVRKEIKDSVCVMSGLSGVGKSTLLNALDPSLCRLTGEISKKIGRGKNTTRTSSFFDVSGGIIADTPGFSSLDFDSYDLHDRSLLADCFSEFAEFSGDCRFGNCSHTKELGCAVLKALEDGKIKKSRHDNYVKMYEELGVFKKWEHEEK